MYENRCGSVFCSTWNTDIYWISPWHIPSFPSDQNCSAFYPKIIFKNYMQPTNMSIMNTKVNLFADILITICNNCWLHQCNRVWEWHSYDKNTSGHTFLSRFLKICIFLEGLKQSSIFVKCLTFSMGVVEETPDTSYS